MSKGINISHIADGEYSVELELDTTAIATEITRLDKKIADLDNQLDGMEAGLERSILELKKTALEKRKEYLEDPANVPENPVEDIWCADLTEDLSDDVGVIEVTGMRGSGFNIQPGYEANAVYDGVRDGKLKPVIASPAAEAYYNWAFQSGWQKWKPSYRYGTITVIDRDEDTCTVQLDDEINPDTGLNVNKMAILSEVPIEYMDCNSVAFAVDDVVLVKFENNNWATPKVIGFKEEPKGCFWEPWGDTLCANHTWTVYSYEYPPVSFSSEICPTLSPNLHGREISLLIPSGVLTLNCGTAIQTQTWVQVVWSSDINDPVIDKTHMVIKLSVSTNAVDIHIVNNWVAIQLVDSDENSAWLYFLHGENFWPWQLTDNGGLEQELLLSDYGLTGSINFVQIYVQAIRLGGSSAVNTIGAIDYIKFQNL